MIVNKPIGAIKINGIISRLSVGKPVPENVLEYWEKTDQLKDLKKAGIIGKDGSAGNSEDEVIESNDLTFEIKDG